MPDITISKAGLVKGETERGRDWIGEEMARSGVPGQAKIQSEFIEDLAGAMRAAGLEVEIK